MTYQSRAINAPTESLSGFVGNLNNSMMRCCRRVPCLCTHRGGLACSLRLYESQIIELNRASGSAEGQQNNRKLNEPCARRQIRFNSLRACLAEQSTAPRAIDRELQAHDEAEGSEGLLGSGDSGGFSSLCTLDVVHA